MDKNLVLRTVSGLVYCAIIILCTTPLGAKILAPLFPSLGQEPLFFGLMGFLMLAGTWECIKIMKFDPKSWERFAVLPLVILVFYRFAKRFFQQGFYFQFNLSEILAFLLIIIAVVTLFRFKEELYQESGKLIFTVIYTALPFSFALGLPSFNRDGNFTLEVFMMFVLIWSSDTFAYLAGRLFGKHKMAPKISPKKTWEGFAGGVILTLILSYFVERNFPDLRGDWQIVGFLIAVFAPIGDLVESQLKRSFGVKDSGNIIPGHGGILDRLDSFIICAPVVYLYFMLSNLI